VSCITLRREPDDKDLERNSKQTGCEQGDCQARSTNLGCLFVGFHRRTTSRRSEREHPKGAHGVHSGKANKRAGKPPCGQQQESRNQCAGDGAVSICTVYAGADAGITARLPHNPLKRGQRSAHCRGCG
jgi:hypothetical protein